jgi:hypothetical protein
MSSIVAHREQRIRERAHALWEAAGSPAGPHDEHFWLLAEKEIDAEWSGDATSDVGEPAATIVADGPAPSVMRPRRRRKQL